MVQYKKLAVMRFDEIKHTTQHFISTYKGLLSLHEVVFFSVCILYTCLHSVCVCVCDLYLTMMQVLEYVAGWMEVSW